MSSFAPLIRRPAPAARRPTSALAPPRARARVPSLLLRRLGAPGAATTTGGAGHDSPRVAALEDHADRLADRAMTNPVVAATAREPSEALRRMEVAFGQPFSDVRIHDDARADAAARKLNARAFTAGSDLFFRSGELAPGTDRGLHLMAHELAHVAQRRAGTSAVPVASALPPIQRQGAPGEPMPPLSLTQELNPNELSDGELDQELARIFRWLRDHPGPSDERTALTDAIQRLAAERDQRGRNRATNQPAIAPPSPAGVSLAANDIDLSPATALLGRAYPFARTPTASEAAAIQAGQAFHYSPAPNAPSIAQPGGQVLVQPSQGLYRNLLTPGNRESAYFFFGRPSPAQQQLNLFGQGPVNQQAEVSVSGADLPAGTLIRPMDRSIVVPGGYRGPGAAVAPGEQLALPLPGGAGTAAEAVPPARAPGMGGAAVVGVGLGIAAGLAQQHRIEQERDTTGYAPAGPAAYSGFFDALAHFFVDPSMRGSVPGDARFNVSTWRENLRKRAAGVPVGGSLSINWQVHRPSPVGIGSMYTGHDVIVIYDRVSATEWRARVPAGGRSENGAVYFGADDGGKAVPSLNVILQGSDADTECELSGSCA